MKVLVACEYSGVVRDAFRLRGHDAFSCDILPTECDAGRHMRRDVLDILNLGWDLMVAHPPCRYLSRAGSLANSRDPGRKKHRDLAMRFFMRLYNAPIQRVCVENPIGYPFSAFRRPDQSVQPFQFGDPHRKCTCLWLRGLPILEVAPLFTSTPELSSPPPISRSPSGKRRHFTESGPRRDRDRTFPGIAQAMAEQWG